MDGIIGSMDMSLSKFRETVKDMDWHAAVHEVAGVGYNLAAEQEAACMVLMCSSQ